MRIERVRRAVFVLCCVVMTGCSGRPSDDDMKSALLVAFSPVVGTNAHIETFEARDCIAHDGVHTCKTKGVLAYTIDLGGRSQDKTQPFVGTYTFVESESGWRLSR